MQLASGFGDPANNYLSFAVGEATDLAREVGGKAFFEICERQWRQRLSFKLRRPAGKRDVCIIC